jgi:hypothetical protein
VVVKTVMESLETNYNTNRFLENLKFCFIAEDTMMGNCVLILQSSTDSPKILVGLCRERSGTVCDDVHEGVIIKAEVPDMDIKVEEMSVVKVEEDTGVNIKEEVIPFIRFEKSLDTKEEDFRWDVISPTIKAEHYQVSYMCVCALLDPFYVYLISNCFCLCGYTKLLNCCELKCI